MVEENKKREEAVNGECGASFAQFWVQNGRSDKWQVRNARDSAVGSLFWVALTLSLPWKYQSLRRAHFLGILSSLGSVHILPGGTVSTL